MVMTSALRRYVTCEVMCSGNIIYLYSIAKKMSHFLRCQLVFSSVCDSSQAGSRTADKQKQILLLTLSVCSPPPLGWTSGGSLPPVV